MFILSFFVILGLIYLVIIGIAGAAGVAKGVGSVANYGTKKIYEKQLAKMRQEGVLISTFEEVDRQEEGFQKWLRDEEVKGKYKEFNKIKNTNLE